MSHRQGSILIYFIGLAAIAVIIGYSFLRSITNDTAAGESADRVALAQGAARQGLNHAIEEILLDVSATNLTVGSGAGGTVSIANPPTFLDGPYRAPFVSQRRPNEVNNIDYYGPDADLDATNEHLVLHPLLPSGSGDYYKWYGLGLSIYDGRGRYIEANHHNLTRPNPGAGAVPVVATPFTDSTAVNPERREALFLDSAYRRVNTGNVATDRSTARYRLRYALGVIDLEGCLLSNPQADINTDYRDLNNDYRWPSAALTAAQHGWYNLVSAFAPPPRYSDQANAVAGLRAEHVFIGRGNTSNFDRRPSDGHPITFPMMFRSVVATPNYGGPEGGNEPYWGRYGLAGQFPDDEASGLFTNASTAASTAGGVALAPPSAGTSGIAPFISTLFGPQVSWRNDFTANTGWYAWNYDGESGNRAVGRREHTLLTTPYGRGLQVSPNAPAIWKPGDARINCPWQVNILTAPTTVVNAMIWAYLPNSVKTLKYTRESYKKYTGVNAFGNNTWSGVLATNVIPEQNRSIHGRDLFTTLSSPAFDRYQPPASPGISPNFQIYDSITLNPNGTNATGVRGEPRAPQDRYPSKLWNGNSSVAGECDDDLGTAIDTNTAFSLHGYCSHSRQPLLSDLGGELTFWIKNAPPKGSPLPGGWGTDPLDSFTWSLDPTIYKFNDSYWWDILKAFSTSTAFMRAQWVQYATSAFNPQTAFTPSSLRDPLSYRNIADLDRLFLRQLGEHFDTPGIPGAMQPRYYQSLTWDGTLKVDRQSWTEGPAANHNIRSLLDADLLASNSQTSLERSKVMELVLNDFRMSFFGAGPSYSETFEPKDFNGDGKVTCSAYVVNLAANSDEIANGTSQWKPVADARQIDHFFSTTGCFAVLKSHHYRIVVRGELWDNLSRKPVADATLDAVLVADPDASNIGDTHIPYQRWHFNRYTGDLPARDN